jgi:hypothetical protein
MNPFKTLLLSRGFSEGASGRFFSPDAKYGDGVVVELSDTRPTAVAVWKGGRTLYEASSPRDVEKFRAEIR